MDLVISLPPPPCPTPSEEVKRVRSGGSIDPTPYEGRTAPPSSQHAKVDLKPLIVSVIPIYSLSDTINLICFLFSILINKLITFNAS